MSKEIEDFTDVMEGVLEAFFEGSPVYVALSGLIKSPQYQALKDSGKERLLRRQFCKTNPSTKGYNCQHCGLPEARFGQQYRGDPASTPCPAFEKKPKKLTLEEFTQTRHDNYFILAPYEVLQEVDAYLEYLKE